jgi:hypothetical protein
MRQYSLNDLESLELKLSPTSMSFVGVIAAPARSVVAAQAWDDDDDYGERGDGNDECIHDPLPHPEGPPGPDPGDNPPVVYPALPPGGPSGPGS